MASVQVNFDTVSKDFLCTVNGLPVPNVHSVEFYKWDDEPIRMMFRQEFKEDDGMETSVMVSADENI